MSRRGNATARINTTINIALKVYIDKKIACGDYSSYSEIISESLRMHRDTSLKRQSVDALIEQIELLKRSHEKLRHQINEAQNVE